MTHCPVKFRDPARTTAKNQRIEEEGGTVVVVVTVWRSPIKSGERWTAAVYWRATKNGLHTHTHTQAWNKSGISFLLAVSLDASLAPRHLVIESKMEHIRHILAVIGGPISRRKNFNLKRPPFLFRKTRLVFVKYSFTRERNVSIRCITVLYIVVLLLLYRSVCSIDNWLVLLTLDYPVDFWNLNISKEGGLLV